MNETSRSGSKLGNGLCQARPGTTAQDQTLATIGTHASRSLPETMIHPSAIRASRSFYDPHTAPGQWKGGTDWLVFRERPE